MTTRLPGAFSGEVDAEFVVENATTKGIQSVLPDSNGTGHNSGEDADG